MPRTSTTIHQGKQFEQTIEQAFQAAYKRSPNDDDPDDQEQLRNMQQYFATDKETNPQQIALAWRLYEITGHTSDLDEALDEFENVKQAVGELFDANQALAILNRRLKLTLDYANQTIAIIERDAAMFITPKGRQWIEKYRDQYSKLSNTIAQSKELTDLSAQAGLSAP